MSKRLKGLLTPKELAFVQMFNGNATEAARLAGYKEPKGSGHKLINIPEVVALIKKKQSKAIEQQGKEEGKRAAVDKGFLDQQLVEAIENCPAQSVASLLRLGYELIGAIGKGAEQELRAGAIKHADGRIEVYQSKWLRENGGSSGNGPTDGAPVVAEDQSPRSVS